MGGKCSALRNTSQPVELTERHPPHTIPTSAPAEGFAVSSVIAIDNLNKTYASGHPALKNINLEIRRGEIFALLGPNGAGKTTLISIICGIVNPGTGSVRVGGFDIRADYRKTRAQIGLVPQEIVNEAFETVWTTVKFSRGLFSKKPNPAYLEQLLRDLSLWDKRDTKIIELSGGMKRRVMIAKALSHEPNILFLDEPTAGVDVELRRDLWAMVRRLRERGVTIILTTHYIEEAEEMADRIGIIHKGEIILIEDKTTLMRKLGKKQLTLQLKQSLSQIPTGLNGYALELADNGQALVFTFDVQREQTGIAELLRDLAAHGIDFRDLQSSESSLEEIFVNLVRARA
jgi:ABC-2 type transport system ATP-binding protein